MAPTKKQPNRRQYTTPQMPKLRWSRQRRLVLCFLFDVFLCDRRQTEQIFSFLFRDHLNDQGILGLAPMSKLRAQRNWMKNTDNIVWLRFQNPEFENSNEAREIRTKIISAARALSLDLRIRTPNGDTSTPTEAHEVSIVSSEITSTLTVQGCTHDIPLAISNLRVTDKLDTGQPQDNLEAAITDLQSCLSDIDSEPDSDEPVVTSHGKLCLWCDNHAESENPNDPIPQSDMEIEVEDSEIQDPTLGRHPDPPDLDGLPLDEIPPLLYRWFNVDSQGENSTGGFLSGLFCVEFPFNREEITNQEFVKHFVQHVTKKKRLTPFISTFRSPLAPIHRALNSQKPASLAIIDTRKLQTEVFSAHPIAKYTCTFTTQWRGYGEYLIWGHVPSEAVIFLSPINRIENLATEHSDINRLLLLDFLRDRLFCDQSLRFRLSAKRKSPYKSGRTFGKLLFILNFPRLYWEYAANTFMKCWGWEEAEETVLFLSGLKSEMPYLNELSDSESEEAHGPFPKSQRSRQESLCSDMDYALSVVDVDSESESESEERDESENESGIMEARSETVDDERFSTHESMSSFGSLINRRERRRGVTESLGVQHGHSAGHRDGTGLAVVVPCQVQNQRACDGDTMSEVLIFEGGSWGPL
ncbi:unnamed protein product [Penicillium olsonii]|nr:unnamed protein product [Penicillium olsonii]